MKIVSDVLLFAQVAWERRRCETALTVLVLTFLTAYILVLALIFQWIGADVPPGE